MPISVDDMMTVAMHLTEMQIYHEHVTNLSNCELQKQTRFEELNPKIMALLYSIIFIFSTFGNTTVIFVMCFRARTRSVTSMLITNLAASDLMLCSTSLWITPLYYYLQDWPWGTLLCHLFPLCQSVSVFNSAMTLLAISLDRYYAVCRNEQSNCRIFSLTPKSCSFLILVIWVVAICLGTPYFLHMNVRQDKCGRKCVEIWNRNYQSHGEIKILYGLLTTLLQFALPLGFIGYSYFQIYLYLQRQCKQSNFRLRIVSTKKSTLFRMLLVMVLTFIICWLPITILNMIRDLEFASLIKPFNKWFMISHVVAMAATMCNPIIYAFMNMTFRDEFARIAPELCIFGKFCQKREKVDGIAIEKLSRPLLNMNHVERVALKAEGGMVEIRRNSSNSSLINGFNVTRPKTLNPDISTKETTPNQNSPVEF